MSDLDDIAESIGTVTEEQQDTDFGRVGNADDLPEQQRNPDDDDYGL